MKSFKALGKILFLIDCQIIFKYLAKCLVKYYFFLPAQVRGTVSPYPIVVTVIWKIFLLFQGKRLHFEDSRIPDFLMSLLHIMFLSYEIQLHPLTVNNGKGRYDFIEWRRNFSDCVACGGKLISCGGPGNESKGILHCRIYSVQPTL